MNNMETVKIYREAENESLIHNEEDLIAYNNLIAELGFSPREVKLEKHPIVYPIINNELKKCLEALCPSSDKIENYTRATIPLEVLRVYKFAKDNEMFHEFHIWYNVKAPDPLLVGSKYRNEEDRVKGYYWNKTYYLIARWGDCAYEIPELLKMGFEKIKQRLIDNAKDAQDKCSLILKNPDVYARKVISNNMELKISLDTDISSAF